MAVLRGRIRSSLGLRVVEDYAKVSVYDGKGSNYEIGSIYNGLSEIMRPVACVRACAKCGKERGQETRTYCSVEYRRAVRYMKRNDEDREKEIREVNAT